MIFLDEACGGLLFVVRLIYRIVKILQILIPIGLILFGLIDLGKAVIAGKEDEMKKAQGTLLKRVIYAVAVFLVVQIVEWATSLVASQGGESWKECWKTAKTWNEPLTNDIGNGMEDQSGEITPSGEMRPKGA